MPKCSGSVISEQTIEFHYGKHHKAYFDTTKDSISTELEGAFGRVVDVAAKDPAMKKLYNNAAQAWNHNLYWKEFVPAGTSKMPAELEEILAEAFGSVEEFKNQIVTKGVGQFGSGWVWLVVNGQNLEVYSTPNGDNPWKNNKFPFLDWTFGCTYYLDYQNLRKKHRRSPRKIVNWDYVLELIKIIALNNFL